MSSFYCHPPPSPLGLCLPPMHGTWRSSSPFYCCCPCCSPQWVISFSFATRISFLGPRPGMGLFSAHHHHKNNIQRDTAFHRIVISHAPTEHESSLIKEWNKLNSNQCARRGPLIIMLLVERLLLLHCHTRCFVLSPLRRRVMMMEPKNP